MKPVAHLDSIFAPPMFWWHHASIPRATLAACLVIACAPPPGDRAGSGDQRSVPDSLELAAGAELYAIHCQSCHGVSGRGTDRGPPLVHQIYRPEHHADAAFYLAVQLGVRAHHWGFGDMPKIARLDREQVKRIVAYVRALQQEADIF